MAGRAAAIRSSGAAAIIVSVPPCAPGKPPDTGLSIMRRPVPSRRAPIARASDGLIVAVRMMIPPSRIVEASPPSSKITDAA